MEPPSLEIVINEIVALHEVAFRSMRRKEDIPKINIIRVGPPEDSSLHSPRNSDNHRVCGRPLTTQDFYDAPSLTTNVALRSL
ncbi:MAG: hypothetical protein Q9N34_06045 [Aquificota bacterium]|nr:hypothetical protein [Aquificota bacterium]